MTSRASLQAALAHRLGSANEARWMVEEVLGADTEPDESTARVLSGMATRRLAGEPLQYVLGAWAFRTVELSVDARALIPRPETEQVVEIALAEVRRQHPIRGAHAAKLRVADLGTGSGAIALSLAVELGATHPALEVVATDLDPHALALAAENLRRVASRHPLVGAQVELRAGSWFDALAPEWRGSIDLVVANPPYVSGDEWTTLEREVRREPYGAIVAGPGADGTPGFGSIEAVLVGAHGWLTPAGAVVVELAPQQAGAARDLALRSGYRDVRIEPDLAGKARAVVGRK
jgi:release factor glutamine methyltransferase